MSPITVSKRIFGMELAYSSSQRVNDANLLLEDILNLPIDSDLRQSAVLSINAVLDGIKLFGANNVVTSFNGGKDAVVVMHIVRAAFALYNKEFKCDEKPKFIFFPIEDEFSEILDFIDYCEATFKLHILRYSCGIKKGIEEFVKSLKPESRAAFVLGTRMGDPNATDNQIFAPSSSWIKVPFMRVNPILNWKYATVWEFLRTLTIPYCILYDQGYTSLGPKRDTSRNPSLQNIHSDPPSYYPAHCLVDGSLERAGRGISSNREDVDSKKRDSQSKPTTLGVLIVMHDNSMSWSDLTTVVEHLEKMYLPCPTSMIFVKDSMADIEFQIRYLNSICSHILIFRDLKNITDQIHEAIQRFYGCESQVHSELQQYLSKEFPESNIDLEAISRLPVHANLLVPNSSETADEYSFPIILIEKIIIIPKNKPYCESCISVLPNILKI